MSYFTTLALTSGYWHNNFSWLNHRNDGCQSIIVSGLLAGIHTIGTTSSKARNRQSTISAQFLQNKEIRFSCHYKCIAPVSGRQTDAS